MGLLDMLGQSLNNSAPAGAPPASAQVNAIEGVMNVINHPSIGGLAGMAQLFQANGMGHLMNGWAGNGPNPPIAPNQLQQVLGEAPIAQFAQKLGLPQDQATNYLAQLLPHVIDHMTPNGTMPPATATPAAQPSQASIASLVGKLFS